MEFNQKDLSAEIKWGVTCPYTSCALRTQVLIQASVLLATKLYCVWIVLDVERLNTKCAVLERQTPPSCKHHCCFLTYKVLTNLIFVSNYLINQGCRISSYISPISCH